ncbi:MAG: ParB/RepB/Spo0J family partition protein [Pyrinomonadaceae bacterium]|nr:ParB/RepB/Spo0J family partition protein [Pyrinomonadaceae bacterium]
MLKRGLPSGVKMRHDSHYVEELTRSHRSIGKTLPIEKLVPNPDQPRVEIGELSELSSSIKQNGVLEPILVKPRNDGTWMIIAGERRWRASNLAGLTEVPCIELDLDENSIAEIALIENLQRKDLTIWEVADGLAYLGEKFGYTHEDIAKKIGKSRSTVTESLTIAGVPESIREKCRKLKIGAKSVILEIARQFDEEAMHQFVDNLSDGGVSRKEVRQKARPASEKSKAKNSTGQTIRNPKKVFHYSSPENNFSVEIRFAKAGEDLTDSQILKALKEAFDSVKSK